MFWYLLLIGHIPSVSMAETKEHLLESAVTEGTPA